MSRPVRHHPADGPVGQVLGAPSGGPATGPARRGERGIVGGSEVLPFGLLIFVCGSLLFVNAWAVVDARFAVASAAREATRAYAESTDEADGRRAADAAARETMVAYDRDPERLSLDGPQGRLVRCGVVAYSASYRVEAIRIPIIGGFGEGITVTASHTARVDELASGLGEESAC